jgi:adenine phosphoribosyltransferase
VDLDQLKALVRDVPDFPQEGVLFKDITPLLADPLAFST